MEEGEWQLKTVNYGVLGQGEDGMDLTCHVGVWCVLCCCCSLWRACIWALNILQLPISRFSSRLCISFPSSLQCKIWPSLSLFPWLRRLFPSLLSSPPPSSILPSSRERSPTPIWGFSPCSQPWALWMPCCDGGPRAEHVAGRICT